MEFDIMKNDGMGGIPEQLYTRNIASSKIIGKVILFDEVSGQPESKVEISNSGQNEAIEFAEWLRTFEALKKENNYWVLESQISSIELFNHFKKVKHK